ncbi:hypothetical protein P3T76_012656 [Phytophthora citrophthora]|uniref:Uncharacterized protein n=1 Tax=Phytophthora citrophthora TaxID=4793 RepID=A0AAD9G3Z4_9STRA|nr:hypothetical protein P3T76_012656 [Phytophthora citrophthora]
MTLEKPVLIATTAIVGATGALDISLETTRMALISSSSERRMTMGTGYTTSQTPGEDTWLIKKTARGYDHGGKTESHAIGKSSANAAV